MSDEEVDRLRNELYVLAEIIIDHLKSKTKGHYSDATAAWTS
jgi:hypothetical protein